MEKKGVERKGLIVIPFRVYRGFILETPNINRLLTVVSLGGLNFTLL